MKTSKFWIKKKKSQLEVKQKIMSKAPLAIFVSQKPVPREHKVQREGEKLGEKNLKQ